MTFPELLKGARKSLGSRAKLSAVLSIPEKTLENWEYRRRTPPAYIVNLLSTSLREITDNGTSNPSK